MKYPMVSSRLFVLILVVALAWLGGSGRLTSAGAQDLEAVPIELETAHGGVPGPIEGPAAQAMYGRLPDDPIEVARRKALADQRYGPTPPLLAATPVTTSLAAAPPVLLGAKGIFDMTTPPSNPTGAIGTHRYIELVNWKAGIFDLNLNLL